MRLYLVMWLISPLFFRMVELNVKVIKHLGLEIPSSDIYIGYFISRSQKIFCGKKMKMPFCCCKGKTL